MAFRPCDIAAWRSDMPVPVEEPSDGIVGSCGPAVGRVRRFRVTSLSYSSLQIIHDIITVIPVKHDRTLAYRLAGS